MKVYVGTYAKYNNGSIAGEWLDLEDYADHEEFIEACHELHVDEEDPQLMFQDREGPDYLLSESSVNPLSWEVMELEETEQLLVEYLVESIGLNIENALQSYEDCHVIHCEYEYEAGEVYFDWLMELNGDTELPFPECYVDKDALYKHDGNDFDFVAGVGLVATR